MKIKKLSQKTNRWLALGLALALVSLGSLTAFAMADSGNDGSQIIPGEPTLQYSYGHYTGTVIDVVPLVSVEGAYHVIIETHDIDTEEGEGSPIWFTVTDSTAFFTDERPEAGDTITGYYDRMAPMLMIYPPQIHALAMVVNPNDTNYYVGYFGDDLVDTDNRLMLVIVEDTQVQLADGTPYEGSLKNQVLAVAYGASTRSIPAQTRPEKVIVLPTQEHTSEIIEEETPPGNPFRVEDWMPPVETAPIVVEDQVLTDAPAPFVNEDRVIMVPLKHIAEALGYNVTWSAELRVVMLSDSFTAAIGQDAYVDMSKDEPISLGTPPVFRDNRTFVPLHFFRDVIPMNNVYYFEHQIDINNQEKMH